MACYRDSFIILSHRMAQLLFCRWSLNLLPPVLMFTADTMPLFTINFLWWIQNSCSTEYQDYNPLVYSVMYFGELVRTFWKNMFFQSSGWNSKNGNSMLFQIIGIHLSSNIMSYLYGLVSEFLATHTEVPGSIPGTTRFSEKWCIWNGVHSVGIVRL
jgi:hypothetical protein